MRATSSSRGSPDVSIGVIAATRRTTARFVRPRWPYRPGVLDAAWAVFSLLNLIAIFWFENWETIPFHFIWISLTLLYGFRTWPPVATMWVPGAVMVTTASGIGLDVWRGSEPPQELTEVPLMAAVFAVMAWHARRKQSGEDAARLISEQNARLLCTQRQFLQDASHQLRIPITIALSHTKLLASDLTGQREGRDIQVVIGELSRLRRISERLLVIAAVADPEFLRPELVALDALLENAVRHTGTDDVIQLSVIRGWPGMPVRVLVADSGSGIPADQLHLIFDRFRTGDDGVPRGTGLGLPLVRAVAHAHGGDMTAWRGQ